MPNMIESTQPESNEVKFTMEIKPIHTNGDYEAAIKQIERLFDAEPGTPKGNKLEVLSVLVEAYETEHYSIPLPDPIEAIEYHMERHGLNRKDLEIYIGGPSRVSEILNRKRPLSVRMMRSLSVGLGIPIEVLARAYELEEPELDLNAVFQFVVGKPIADFKSENSGKVTSRPGRAKISAAFMKDFLICVDYKTAGTTSSGSDPIVGFNSSELFATEGKIQ
jgi:HTH-type transcriptional regulator / antitoxin HigA